MIGWNTDTYLQFCIEADADDEAESEDPCFVVDVLCKVCKVTTLVMPPYSPQKLLSQGFLAFFLPFFWKPADLIFFFLEKGRGGREID